MVIKGWCLTGEVEVGEAFEKIVGVEQKVMVHDSFADSTMISSIFDDW